MADERVELRAVFQGVDFRNRIALGGIGGQPVNRLGGHGHSFALAQMVGASCKAFGVGIYQLAHSLSAPELG
jgi:hypothetical protein